MGAPEGFFVRTVAGDTADLAVWRALGRGSGAVEAVLEANPGLAALGPVLPAGHLVFIPDLPAGPTETPLLQLWD